MPGTGGNVQRDIASLALVCMATGKTGTVKILSMDRIKSCSNCLNAYQSPHDRDVHCVNREWLKQSHPNTRTVVTSNETCGTWQQRNQTQKALMFTQPVQTELFET